MFTILVSIFIYWAFLAVWAAVTAIICFYIFRDSKKHKMNTLLWVIIGLIFSILGLCAYFIAKNQAYKTRCPVCFAKTDEWSTFCSACGTKLDDVRPRMKLFEKILIGICGTFIVFSLIELIFTTLYST